MTSVRLLAWRRKQWREYGIGAFYYIVAMANLPSILRHGILPYNRVREMQLQHEDFSLTEVQALRNKRKVYVTGGARCDLHDLVPLYYVPFTPTILKASQGRSDLCLIAVDPEVLTHRGVELAFCDGNAASSSTSFYWDLRQLSRLPWEVLQADNWVSFSDGKRKRCAEMLVKPAVPVRRFICLYTPDSTTTQTVTRMVRQSQHVVDVRTNPTFFP